MHETAWKGMIGTGSSLFTIAMTTANVEQWLRIAGASVGILVTVATFVSITLDVIWKWQHRRDRNRINREHSKALSER